MTRIEGATASWGKPLLRLVYRIAHRKVGQIAERDTARAIEPLEAYGHLPGLMLSYSMLESATGKANRVEHRLKDLAVLKAATLSHCEYCIDIASSIARKTGLSDEQLLALPSYRENELFDELEKLVLDYAVGISRTPIDVPDALFASLREHFDERQMVELTNEIALENMRARFNTALGIGAAGFTEGMVCARAETAPAVSNDAPPHTADVPSAASEVPSTA
jgi:AhpD family alkylhydroperoxidase